MTASSTFDIRDLDQWRAHLQTRLLSVCWWACMVVGLPSLALLLKGRVWVLAATALLNLIWMTVLYSQRHRASKAMAIQLLLIVYSLGVAMLVTVGFVAVMSFMAMPVLAVLFLSNRAAAWCLAINGVSLVALGLAFNINTGLPFLNDHPIVPLLLVAVNFLVLNAIVTWACAVLLDGARQLLNRQAQNAEVLQHLVMHDPLTALPNRRMLQERMSHDIAASKANHRVFAVVLMDLDQFKEINDTHGHGLGDELLKAVAARLRNAVRETDTVARLGGDEFVVLFQIQTDGAELKAMLDRLFDSVCGQYLLSGQAFEVGTSCGVAVFPRDGEDQQTLLKHADVALYRAKAAGRRCYRFFSLAGDAHIAGAKLVGLQGV